jgi:hypothetical protein
MILGLGQSAQRLRFRRVAIGPTLLAAAMASGAGAAAGTAPSTSIAPCRPGTPEHKTATQQLDALAAVIRRVENAGDLKRAQKQLDDLLASRCFALSIEAPTGYQTSSRVAFRRWWDDGGQAWVGSYLEGDTRQRLPAIVVPPDVIESLVPGDADGEVPSAALAGLLCPATDAACGAEARGYRRRAERFFATSGQPPFEDCLQRTRDSAARAPSIDPCGRSARAGDYPAWRACVAEGRPRVPVLPWGDTRGPRGGWLTIRLSDATAGAGCTRTRFFHVDSGSVHVVDQCPPAAAAGTEGPARPAAHVETGQVPPGFLREALWGLLLAERFALHQVNAHRVPVPAGLMPRWPAGRAAPAITSCGAGPSVHSPTLAWLWQDAANVVTQGAFSVAPTHPGGTYAAFLVDVLIESFARTTPAVPLPPALLELASAKMPARGGSP